MQSELGAARPVIDIAIPVYNEERDLEASVRTLYAYIAEHVAYRARITIVDNASTDSTPVIARRLAHDLDRVRFLRLDEKGRGRALRAAWMNSDADIVAYMDVDLSTSLDALCPLVEPIIAGRADIAIGSRLTHGARVTRGLKRECISRGYNLLLRIVLHARYRDAQCGFKAVRAGVARQLLPMVRDEGWFFDTELLTVAERAGVRIVEIPVAWIEDTDSRVHIASTAMTDLRGVARMLRSQPSAFTPSQTGDHHISAI
jgi:glycosyltransferase involved in cell wall biosynthesis